MYGGELIFVIVGIVLLIINICMIAKFFQIASNVEKLTKLYVDGVKNSENGEPVYYELPARVDEEKTRKAEEQRKAQQDKIEKMTIYYNKK